MRAKQSTCRTQSRVSVSQALERIRRLTAVTPEVGAVCGKAARTDLCGGREVTRVPTAKGGDFRCWHISDMPWWPGSVAKVVLQKVSDFLRAAGAVFV